jgi:hypothetical protein
MAKNSKTDGKKYAAFVLAFIGSLAYIYVAYGLVTNWSIPSIFSGVGAVFLPIFAGLGIISSVGLLLASFGLLTGSEKTAGWVWKSGMWGGVTLVALTLGNANLVWIIVLGFALATISSAVAGM